MDSYNFELEDTNKPQDNKILANNFYKISYK
jgi:hypothetical protein